MLVRIPGVLSEAEAAEACRLLDGADWVDGRVTAGHQSARVKHNQQLAEGHPLAQELGARIVGALQRQPLFVTAALPLHIFPPLFNRYGTGDAFGSHVDNSIRRVPGSPHRIRTDLSCTLFLSGPDAYEGGELMVEDVYGVHAVKLPAGDLVLYPSTSLHRVQPVTRGVRVCSFFWIQSLVRDDGNRTLLFDLDSAIRALSEERPDHPVAVSLTAIDHNLLRKWAEL